jgi:VanZ family protein
MTNSQTFHEFSFINIPNLDKLVHFMMFFGLMSVIILENRKTINSARNLFLTGLIPLFYGIVIEVLQSAFTVSRTGSIYDVFADFVGILVSILIWLWIQTSKEKVIK